MDGEVIGVLESIEFVADDEAGDEDPRVPGTYITVRVPDETRWTAGTVAIRYLPKSDQN